MGRYFTKCLDLGFLHFDQSGGIRLCCGVFWRNGGEML